MKIITMEEIENKINKKENLIISDSSLNTYHAFYDKLLENGYTIKVVNFNNPYKSNGWNPLSYINYIYKKDKDVALDLVKDWANELLEDENSNSDPFWIKMARSYFVGTVLFLLDKYNKTDLKNKKLDFNSILSVKRCMNKRYKKQTDGNILKVELSQYKYTDPIYIALDPIVSSPKETRLSILSVYDMNIEQYALREKLMKSFTNASFKIEEISSDKTAIFVVEKPGLESLSNVLLKQICNHVKSNGWNANYLLEDIGDKEKLFDDSIEDKYYLINSDKISFNEKKNLPDLNIEDVESFDVLKSIIYSHILLVSGSSKEDK